MEEIKTGLFVSRNCKGCMAVDQSGNPLRDLIDKKKDEGWSTKVIVKELVDDGVFLSQPNLDRHFRLHSPWLREKRLTLSGAKVSNAIQQSNSIHRNADQELQKLVDLGAERIDNGEILVDKELYMFALDRKTKNQTPMTIQNLVLNLGEALIEHPIIEGEYESSRESEKSLATRGG